VLSIAAMIARGASESIGAEKTRTASLLQTGHGARDPAVPIGRLTSKMPSTTHRYRYCAICAVSQGFCASEPGLAKSWSSNYWAQAVIRCRITTGMAKGTPAYRLIAEALNGLASPDEAVFYTSGRTSNGAAFAYQLMVRSYGTNNLPDCSNMCHESSGTALIEAIGIGKGSVTVEDITLADLIVIAGQNPGTNHPRMLSVLEKAKANGAKIIAVNPLPEAGLIQFKDPQKVHGVVGHGIPIADEFVQIRIGGDMALFAGLGRLLLEADDRAPAASSTTSSSRRTAPISTSTKRKPARLISTRCWRPPGSTGLSWN